MCRSDLKTDINAKWPFSVIYFGVNEKPLRDYIIQYNNGDFVCESSEDIASDSSENRHFQLPNSHLMLPFQ